MTVTNIAVIAHDGLWEHTPLTLFTLLALLALTLCMNKLFYYDWLGHQELENIAHDGLWEPYAITRMGWIIGCMGRTDHTPQTVTTTRAPAVLKTTLYEAPKWVISGSGYVIVSTGVQNGNAYPIMSSVDLVNWQKVDIKIPPRNNCDDNLICSWHGT